MKRTIALLDTTTGWTFHLHSEDRRVWLDAYPSGAPVPTAFLAGDRAAEFELLLGACRSADDMTSAARRILPVSIAVAPLEFASAA